MLVCDSMGSACATRGGRSRPGCCCCSKRNGRGRGVPRALHRTSGRADDNCFIPGVLACAGPSGCVRTVQGVSRSGPMRGRGPIGA
jgi:hypothetical protein